MSRKLHGDRTRPPLSLHTSNEVTPAPAPSVRGVFELPFKYRGEAMLGAIDDRGELVIAARASLFGHESTMAWLEGLLDRHDATRSRPRPRFQLMR